MGGCASRWFPPSVHGIEGVAKMAQESTVDPSMDVELFGKEIGSALVITVRFAKRAE